MIGMYKTGRWATKSPIALSVPLRTLMRKHLLELKWDILGAPFFINLHSCPLTDLQLCRSICAMPCSPPLGLLTIVPAPTCPPATPPLAAPSSSQPSKCLSPSSTLLSPMRRQAHHPAPFPHFCRVFWHLPTPAPPTKHKHQHQQLKQRATRRG
jgi:hypothetical protein